MEIVLYFRPPGKSYSKPEKLAGVLEIAEKAHVHVQVIEEPIHARRIQQLQAFWNFPGAIVECGGRDEAIDPHVFGTVPVVFFNHSFETLPKRCFAIRHDSKSTGVLAARELLRSNVPNFAYIPALTDTFWNHERRLGFVHSLALNGKRCIDFSWAEGSCNATERIQQLQTFLRQLPKPCAIFAATDAVAADVITASRLCEITIPDEISVLGVDNATDICEHTKPTLSSIEPDFWRGGNLAMLLLLAVMHDGKEFRGSRQQTFSDVQVVRRLSTPRLLRRDPVVSEALDLIRQKSCTGLTAADVVRLFPCSRRMADLRFVQAVGHTILDEIQSVRLERAQQLLLNSNQPLKAISDFCGFRHPNSLRKFFRKETGLTLSDWRRKNQNKH